MKSTPRQNIIVTPSLNQYKFRDGRTNVKLMKVKNNWSIVLQKVRKRKVNPVRDGEFDPVNPLIVLQVMSPKTIRELIGVLIEMEVEIVSSYKKKQERKMKKDFENFVGK
jgi:hypothetical protein